MLNRFTSLYQRSRAALTGVPQFVRTYDELKSGMADAVEPEYDLVYVVPPRDFQGWIIDAICREIDSFVDGRTAFVPLKDKLPPSRAYYYSHYGYLRDTLRNQPEVLHARNILLYTHPRDLWYPHDELIHVMNHADAIVSMCSMFVDDLVRDGVREDLVEVGLLGADPNFFSPHERGTGRVGFCSGYMPRKGGDRVLDVIRSMPQREFILCGKKWPEWERFDELSSLSNLEYIDIPYAEYPNFYNSIDVFVSVSELEGGPVPLIESAMANCVPVCSLTGHGPDIIQHGKNGFLFDPQAPISEVCDLIEQALHLEGDIRATVQHLTWQRFSRQIQTLAGLTNQAAACTSDAA